MSPTSDGPNVAPAALPILGYVQDETRAGVSVLRDVDAVRVITSPVHWTRVVVHWRTFLGGYGVACLLSIFWGNWGGLSGIPLAALFIYHLVTCRRRQVFEITPTHVRVGYTHGRKPTWKEVWRRLEVTEIRANRYTGQLLVRILGKDLKDYWISTDRRAVDAVAAALNEATEEIPAIGLPPLSGPDASLRDRPLHMDRSLWR